MRRKRISAGLLIEICILTGAFSMSAYAAESAPDGGGVEGLIRRMAQLENRVSTLEQQVITLRQEKADVERQLEQRKEETAVLKSPAAQPGTDAGPHQLAAAAKGDPAGSPILNQVSRSSVGVRAGYQGFPFGQREGGFFYGAYVGRTLISETDGAPLGELGVEFGAGVAESGTDKVVVNSTVVGAPETVKFRQRMISVWPGARYSFNFLRYYGIAPYLTGGPGIWIDIIETPPLIGGLQFPTKELAARKLPIPAGASLFEGAEGGAGAELDLARLHWPVLDRVKLGFDYRYSAWTSGQRFNTYSLLLSYSE